jgi:predicted Zn finger-like uncharacterized protein
LLAAFVGATKFSVSCYNGRWPANGGVFSESAMPITAQCRSCAARYKVVESAAGRRVKCRRCGTAMKLSSAEPAATPAMDLRALADVERKGQILASSPEQEFEQYKSAVAALNKPSANSNLKKDYRSIHDLAGPGAAKFTAGTGAAKKKADGSGGLMALAFLGAAGLAVLATFVPVFFVVNWAIGSIIMTAGKIWGTVVVFQDSASAGVMYLVVPFYGWHYRRTHPEEMRKPIQVTLAGFLVIVLTIIALRYGGGHQS